MEILLTPSAAPDLNNPEAQAAIGAKISLAAPLDYYAHDRLATAPIGLGVIGQTPEGVGIAANLSVGTRRNIWRYTEDLSYAGYVLGASTTKGTETISVDLGNGASVVLTKLTATNFYSQLRTSMSGLGLTPYVVGKRYLFSCYVLNLAARDQFFWMRTLVDSSSKAHGPKLLPAGSVNRVWILGQATSTTQIDFAYDPAVALGSGAASGNTPVWLFMATPDGTDGGYTGAGDNTLALYIGGFAIELAADNAKDGIAVIGDSTVGGAAGDYDAAASREWPGWLAAILNAPTYNRGIGGNTLAQMDTRWATDITPLAATAKYAVAQGGINDLTSGRSVAQMQASMVSMAAKALSDGLIFIPLNVTPFAECAADAAMEAKRVEYNAWLARTYPLARDIASVVADPGNAALIRQVSGWVGDGKHPDAQAKRAVAQYLATSIPWVLPKPSAYQRIAVTTFTAATTSVAATSYADDAAADADTALPAGGLYRTTAGGRAIFRKP